MIRFREAAAYTVMHDDPPEKLAFGLPVARKLQGSAEARVSNELLSFALRELAKTCLRGMHIRLDDAFVPQPAAFRDKTIDDFFRHNRSILSVYTPSAVDLRAIVHSVVNTHLRLGGGNTAITDAVCERIHEALATPR